MEYCPTKKMGCDILNKPNQGAPYRMECSHLMNFPVDYNNKVEPKATHPAVLDTKQDNMIEVLPRNCNIPKDNPSPVHKSVLGGVLKKLRWDLARVSQRNGFWGSAQDITKVNILEQVRAFKSQVIGRARVGPTELAGERVYPCH